MKALRGAKSFKAISILKRLLSTEVGISTHFLGYRQLLVCGELSFLEVTRPRLERGRR